MAEEEFCALCSELRREFGLIIPAQSTHINCRDYRRGYTLLHEAIRSSQTILFDRLMLNPHLDLNVGDRKGNTPLHLAIRKKQIVFAEKLINSHCDVNKQNGYENTPLMYAVVYDELNIAHKILKKDADVNRQNYLGYTAVYYACHAVNFDMFDLLVMYGADFTIKNNDGETIFMNMLRHSRSHPEETKLLWQRTLLDFETDVNEINASGFSTLFLAIQYKSPVLEEIINRGADVNYLPSEELNSLHLALQTSNSKAFDLIWPKFNYHEVYCALHHKIPLLYSFFYSRLQEDWLHCYNIVCESDVMENAIQHYSSCGHLPPLISQVVEAFAKRDLSEAELFPHVCVLLSYNARVLLSDIETVYICYGDSSDTLNFLYDMDMELEQSGRYYISHPYIMLKVNRDVNSIFNSQDFLGMWPQQLMFLPTLFQFCTPTYRFIWRLCLMCDRMQRQLENGEDFFEALVTTYRVLKSELMALKRLFFPSLIELSRNATRAAICARFNIKEYSEYRRLLYNFVLPQAIINILLFRTELNVRYISLPDVHAHTMIRSSLVDGWHIGWLF